MAYSQWWVGDSSNRKPIAVKAGKRSGKNVVAQLAGIDSRELAEKVIGQQISVLRSDLPALEDEEYYWTDLVGCEVSTLQGVIVGPVERLFETGANDVMVVKDQRVGQGVGLGVGPIGDPIKDQKVESDNRNGDILIPDILIPWIRPSVIVTVDLPERRIVVDWDPDF